ncbi:hypothetical protein BJV78DRAFT_1285417 [Lactifluus subvellereus]|nr:hypothetical protein BJV78DRAFT_1285417 [Lactifluus subvellereus]
MPPRRSPDGPMPLPNDPMCKVAMPAELEMSNAERPQHQSEPCRAYPLLSSPLLLVFPLALTHTPAPPLHSYSLLLSKYDHGSETRSPSLFSFNLPSSSSLDSSSRTRTANSHSWPAFLIKTSLPLAAPPLGLHSQGALPSSPWS